MSILAGEIFNSKNNHASKLGSKEFRELIFEKNVCDINKRDGCTFVTLCQKCRAGW
jgi:hypothetical protein